MIKQRYRVLLAEPHPGADVLKETLGGVADIIVRDLTQKELEEAMAKEPYDVVICNVWHKITDHVINSSSPSLKVIATMSVGYDHIDVDAARRRGIIVVNAAYDHVAASTYAVAEHTFALLLDLLRKTPRLYEDVRRGVPPWEELMKAPPSTWSVELFGRTLGIIGVGRIGSHVARIARGFCLNVLGYDPYVDREKVQEVGVKLVSLEELLSSSDFISINCVLTAETRGMISRETVSLMKVGVYIINTARGEIVDEDAIIEGLRAGRISGYAADVLTGEPPTEDKSPLLRAFRDGEFANRLLITPHIAFATDKAIKRYALIVGEKILRALKGEAFPAVGDFRYYNIGL